MITAQVDNLRATLPDILPLLAAHYRELSLHVGRFALKPDFDAYLQREDAGELLYVTLREDGRIVGYFIGFVGAGLHYGTCLTLGMDIFYIDPARRNAGAGAIKLFRCVEREARRLGVNLWFCGSKLHRDTGRLFKALGFAPVETAYSKWLCSPEEA